MPFGDEAWRPKKARQLGLEHTFRCCGRPRKYLPDITLL
jgi:hypothetical protein